MASSETEIEELRKLQQAASERRAQRNKDRSAASEEETSKAADEPVESEAEAPITADTGSAGGGAEAALPSPDLSEQFESLLQQLEEAASERPALALLAAFSVGVIVGQLFPRR